MTYESAVIPAARRRAREGRLMTGVTWESLSGGYGDRMAFAGRAMLDRAPGSYATLLHEVFALTDKDLDEEMYDEEQAHTVGRQEGVSMIFMPAYHRLRSPSAAAVSYAWGY